MEPKLLRFGVGDMAFGSIIYALEFYQWGEFEKEWRHVICENFGGIFSKCKKQSFEEKKEKMFEGAMRLKGEVMNIIDAFKSVKDDITSLKKSISHLSSLVQDSARVSIVRDVSILNREESKFTSDEEFASFSVSPEVSQHEIVIRKNICKLKRDISRKIMNNLHLKKIVSDFPLKKDPSPRKSFKISVVQGKILNLENLSNDLTPAALEDQEVLDHLESNIDSYIPSHEATSILSEHKSSILFPQAQRYNPNSRNLPLRPEALKKRLNSDIQKCQFYENL